MISIVMSTYNSMAYIKEQLDSIKNQTFKDIEVIISDDKSTDNTIEYIKDYIKNNNLTNWKLFTNDNNVGYALNFKRGISKASGDIIFLCDHDDIWFPTKIEEVSKLFDDKKINLVGTSFTFIDSNSKVIEDSKSLGDKLTSNHKLIKYHIGNSKLKKLSFKKIFTYSFTPGCCMAFRNNKGIIDIINKAPHDYVISLYYANINSTYFYNKPLIYYRIHNNNQIGIKDKNDVQERIKVLSKDINDKNDMINNLSNLTRKNKKYAEKHIRFLLKRDDALKNNKKSKLYVLLFRAFFMNRYFYTILKDIKSL